MDTKKSSTLFIIFGGAGFLGQHLIFLLLKEFPNAKIKVLDLKPHRRPPYSFENDNRITFLYNRDITRSETYSADLEGGDCLFNLVGYISFWAKDQDKMFAVNVDGVRQLLTAAKIKGIKKIIHVSSVAAIGYIDDKLKAVDETLSVNWHKFRKKYYMYTKYLGEREALYFKNEGVNIVVINPGAMYGPGDLHNTFELFDNLAKGKIPFYPPGGTGISDVRDVARGMIAAYKKGKSGERYILVSENLTFEQTFKLASKALKVNGPNKRLPFFMKNLLKPIIKIIEILSVKRPAITTDEFTFGFIFRYYSSKKAKLEIDWHPQITLAQSIQDAANWYIKEGLIDVTSD
jgi:dihydroflavonol-4-reductase